MLGRPIAHVSGDARENGVWRRVLELALQPSVYTNTTHARTHARTRSTDGVGVDGSAGAGVTVES